ncbi:MAG: hypothetical protein WDN02_12125 [Methylovirgula sp.]|uniref:hypothetical protein n=1 Tax=Methylovirgula sp. TaxID=1978224 RepID=UPI0030767049
MQRMKFVPDCRPDPDAKFCEASRAAKSQRAGMEGKSIQKTLPFAQQWRIQQAIAETFEIPRVKRFNVSKNVVVWPYRRRPATLQMLQLLVGNSQPVANEFGVLGQVFKLADEIQFLVQDISVNRAFAMLRLDNFFATIKAVVELDDDFVAENSPITVEIDAITFGEREPEMVSELQTGHDACHRVAHEGKLEIIVPIVGVEPLSLRRKQMLGRCFAVPPIFRSDHFLNA